MSPTLKKTWWQGSVLLVLISQLCQKHNKWSRFQVDPSLHSSTIRRNLEAELGLCGLGGRWGLAEVGGDGTTTGQLLPGRCEWGSSGEPVRIVTWVVSVGPFMGRVLILSWANPSISLGFFGNDTEAFPGELIDPLGRVSDVTSVAIWWEAFKGPGLLFSTWLGCDTRLGFFTLEEIEGTIEKQRLWDMKSRKLTWESGLFLKLGLSGEEEVKRLHSVDPFPNYFDSDVSLQKIINQSGELWTIPQLPQCDGTPSEY